MIARVAAIICVSGEKLRKLLYPRMGALQHLYGGGFSGTIGAEQTEANSFWYRKINAVNGDDTGVVLDQIGGTDDGCHEIFLPSM